MTPDLDTGYYVMPKFQWNNATVHHPAPEATREDPTPLCDVSTDTEAFHVADGTHDNADRRSLNERWTTTDAIAGVGGPARALTADGGDQEGDGE